MQLDRLFRPASIAVVGATDRAGSYGNAAVSNLLAAGFGGRLVGIHPTRTEVHGVHCVPTLDAMGEAVDAVVIATPADSVPELLETAGQMGCGGAVVFAAEFAETGRTDRQDALIAAAARHGLPVIGPNANGIVSVAGGPPFMVGKKGRFQTGPISACKIPCSLRRLCYLAGERVTGP